MNTSAAKSYKGFTLVEIMIVVAIIALLAAIAVPGFLRARKRSQASRILNDLRMIDSAVDQYAIETNRENRRCGQGRRLDELLEKGFAPFTTTATAFWVPLMVTRRSTP